MLNENAQKLVAALRSGEFEQAQHALREDDSFCCLGVACELYRREHPDEGDWIENETIYEECRVLPHRVQRWLGFTYKDGQFYSDTLPHTWSDGLYSGGTTLADLNDSGCSFEGIANTIESEPDGLFS